MTWTSRKSQQTMEEWLKYKEQRNKQNKTKKEERIIHKKKTDGRKWLGKNAGVKKEISTKKSRVQSRRGENEWNVKRELPPPKKKNEEKLLDKNSGMKNWQGILKIKIKEGRMHDI